MIFFKAITNSVEAGKAYEQIAIQDLTPERQRYFLTLALQQMSGISVSFDANDVKMLSQAGMFSNIAPDDIRPGSLGKSDIIPDQIDNIGTTLRNFTSKRTDVNILGTAVMLRMFAASGENLVDIRLEPEFFRSVVEKTFLKPIEPETKS